MKEEYAASTWMLRRFPAPDGLRPRVMPDNQLLSHKPALDANARALLGRQLRSYYERLRSTTVSESLAQLLYQFETGAISAGAGESDEPMGNPPHAGSR